MNSFKILWLSLLMVGSALPSPSQKYAYKYFRVGNEADVTAVPRAGFALMGGGKDLDEAFRWLCIRGGGGDFLVLRASGTAEYNRYVQSMCRLNSVATLVIPSREAALDPFVATAISHASALFISGGDQANYINFWMGTPVQAALNDAIKRGVPIGGTSPPPTHATGSDTSHGSEGCSVGASKPGGAASGFGGALFAVFGAALLRLRRSRRTAAVDPG